MTFGEPQLASETSTSPRLDWIEVAKGMGIVFVILVHSMIPWLNPVTIHLSSFTIPLFFVLAGLTYNNDRYRGNLRRFAVSRGKQFLIPYFCLYALMMVLFVPLSPNIDTTLTSAEVAFWFAYGNGPPLSASHLWFLPVMYFGLMVFVVADRLMQNLPPYSRVTLAVVFPLTAIFVQSLFAPALVPWRLGGVFIAATFVLIGNIMRHNRGLTSWLTYSKAADVTFFVALSILLVALSSLNGFTDIAVDNFGNSIWLYVIAGMMGSTAVFLASSALVYSLKTRNLFMALGKNSQELYEIHPIAFYLIPLVGFLFSLPVGDPTLFDLLWPIRFLLGVSIGFLLTKYVITKNRFLSIMFRGSAQISSPTGGSPSDVSA
ncbi:MAG: acyltransferase [Candidatus Thorarchaeota archaeon]|nr:acyltransferase [Candidatus Thorarchaeota archaeon]